MFCPVMWLCSDTDERDRNSECGEVVSSPCMICVSNIPPAFLPHFPSDILLLTIFVTGWLPPPCLMWRRKRTWWSASKKTSVNWSFSKTLTSDARTISSHKWWLNIFQQNFVHQYIVSRTKLSLYHETEEEVEGISKPAGRTNVKSLFFCLIQNWMKNKFLITIGPAFLPPSPITPVKWQSPVGEPHFSKMMMTMTDDGQYRSR